MPLARPLLVCLAASVSLASSAQQPARIEGKTLVERPTIDGTVSADEWASASTFNGLRDSGTGAVAADDGQFWIAYDKDYIYFAAKLSDSQPASIKATEYRTNVSLEGDDNVSVFLDLSGSLADFNGFVINPRGATDIQLAGGRAAKREWSGEFLAKGRVTESGWECEARIPWQIMRLPGAGQRDIRLAVVRHHMRTGRDTTTAYTSNQTYQNAAYWSAVELPKTSFDRSLRILPYTYLGYGDGDGTIVNAGVDAKTQLTEEIPVVLSINPDFRNIENQILSLDFSRFERLAGETRPFFQEGGQYYNSALFASQRIRSFDAGLNVYGKINDELSFGVLNTVTFGTNDNLAANFSYDPTPYDSFRVTATSLMQDGMNNDAYLLRYQRLFGPLALFLRNMGTKDAVEGNGVFNTAGLYYVQGPLFAYAQHDAVAPNFFPRLGFAPETDYSGFVGGFAINQPVAWGSIVEAGVGFDGVTYDRYDGGFYRNQMTPNVFLAFKDGTAVSLVSDWETFLGSKDHFYQINIRRPRNDPYNNVALDYQEGEFTGTYYQSMRVSTAWRPIQRLQATGAFQVVEFGGRSEQAIVGMNYDMGNDQSLSGRMVKRGADWNAYIAFRRSGNRGTEYFLILGDPNAQTFRTSLILKVSMPFEIRR